MSDQSPYATILQQTFSTTTQNQTVTNTSIRDNVSIIRAVGHGTCGTVYGIRAIKRVIKLGRNEDALRRDFAQTKKAWQSVQSLEHMLQSHFHSYGLVLSIPNIPRCFRFYSNCSQRIQRYEHELSGDESSSQSEIDEEDRDKPGFTMQRIPPIPTAARIALVKELFAGEDQDRFLNNPENDDCLLRLYFGKVVDDDERFEDLRNFPLHDDQMDDIGLDTHTLVIELAIGLAIIHWGAELDGMDVEFVLSARFSARIEANGTINGAVAEPTNETRRSTHLWVLDFDKAKPISIKEDRDALIRRLVVATSGNDPYFPRPSVNEERWNQFKWAYIEAGKKILKQKIDEQVEEVVDGGLLDLPALFISALDAQFEWEDEREEEAFIQFEAEDEEESDEDTFVQFQENDSE
ncbi:hypothetical protein PT974_07666 [Cladobotryum mycophilum]|uniref:DUF3669 domain-containing protein n=1 Tax=Cladobotryum mycophilum TaxID=491253 RepID=A0ABR0SQ28_9HYPO